MDIKKEIDSAIEAFQLSSNLNKSIKIIWLLVAASSVTSLSDGVIAWKGFILDAINAYEFYFVKNIKELASTVGFFYSDREIHVATITSIAVVVGMRILAEGLTAAFKDLNTRYNSNAEPNLAVFKFIGVATPLGIWLWYGLSAPTIRLWLAIPAVIFYPFCIVVPKFIMSKFGWEMFEKGTYNYFVRYYLYMALILSAVGILAAVNIGLREDVQNRKVQSPNQETIASPQSK